MAAWFVSNCKTFSGRNEYVRLLQKFVQVDVYGNCGTMQCDKNKNEACREMVLTIFIFINIKLYTKIV